MTGTRALSRLGFVTQDGRPIASLENPRPHEAAGRGPRTANWFSWSTGPSAEASGDLQLLRDRSRNQYRNSGWIRRGLNLQKYQIIGTHIAPLWELDDTELKTQFNELWRLFVKYADADNVLSFYGQLALAELTRWMAGEVFIRFRPRRRNAGLPVPLQIQLLEPEYCPHTLNEILPNGNRIINGIEVTRTGQRVAYWLYTQHPHDQSLNMDVDIGPIRIRASQILHYYMPTRPGAMRAVPETTQAIPKAQEYRDYNAAELLRKKNKAAITAFVERDYRDEADWNFDPMTGEALDSPLSNDSNIWAGQYNLLLPGEKIKTAEGDNAGVGYEHYQRWELLAMAASLDAPYQSLSGDYENINDRLWRAIQNDFERSVDSNRAHGVIHQVCQPVVDHFVDICWLNDLIDLPDFENLHETYKKVKWQPQARRYLHPVQDVESRILEIRHGLNSRTGAAAELGRDSEQIDAQQDEDDARREYGQDLSESNTGSEVSPPEADTEIDEVD